MPPTRSRPAHRGVATLPPSLFLIRGSERRRTWRPESRLTPTSCAEIDLRSPVVADAANDDLVADPME